ncbi:MAG: GNAT family N-acetyltransferase [Candidatus Omnitrophica bacterium]|nr:GNAT family N-acetyltransferase [Candidatus Omnitrophota bacterium]
MIISKRHKKLALKTIVARKISRLPPGDWNKTYPDVLESYDFFKTLDDSNLEQFSLYYIMVYDRTLPVGATVCFLMDYPMDSDIGGPLKRVTTFIRKLMPKFLSLKILFCGMPLGQGRIGITGQADTVMQVITRRIEQIARKNKAAVIVFKGFDQASALLLDPLKKAGFSKIKSLPSTELKIDFKDFEGYLKTLSSASRYDLRRKFKKVDGQVDISLETAVELKEDTLQEVYRLYLELVNKHDMGFELMPLDFFRKISRNMPNHAKYFLWRIEGRLVAFMLCFVSTDLFMDYYLGLDYSVAHKYHLYFIKLRDTLNWCIKHGIKKYDMGFTGYETKKRLDFDLIPLYIYVKLRNRALRPVYNLICKFLKKE